MPFAPVSENILTAENNRAYYNEIAVEYDAILDHERTNEVIRKAVEEKFKSVVVPGWVIDFGGGTGRDLDWLVKNNYKVIFCEPSEKMRAKAFARHKNDPFVLFPGTDRIDFTDWSSRLPFGIKADAILSDFAVINCIDNIGLLFKNLSLVIKPGGSLIALMLKHGHKKSWRWRLRELVRPLISRKPVIINVQYKTHRQIVYVYSINEIKRASSPYFDMCSSEDMAEFTLFHFMKK